MVYVSEDEHIESRLNRFKIHDKDLDLAIRHFRKQGFMVLCYNRMSNPDTHEVIHVDVLLRHAHNGAAYIGLVRGEDVKGNDNNKYFTIVSPRLNGRLFNILKFVEGLCEDIFRGAMEELRYAVRETSGEYSLKVMFDKDTALFYGHIARCHYRGGVPQAPLHDTLCSLRQSYKTILEGDSYEFWNDYIK